MILLLPCLTIAVRRQQYLQKRLYVPVLQQVKRTLLCGLPPEYKFCLLRCNVFMPIVNKN
jgi:hypothetical protein